MNTKHIHSGKPEANSKMQDVNTPCVISTCELSPPTKRQTLAGSTQKIQSNNMQKNTF